MKCMLQNEVDKVAEHQSKNIFSKWKNKPHTKMVRWLDLPKLHSNSETMLILEEL